MGAGISAAASEGKCDAAVPAGGAAAAGLLSLLPAPGSSTGVLSLQLSGVRPGAVMPHVAQLGAGDATYTAAPAYDGTLEAMVAELSEGADAATREALSAQTRNKVRKCPACGKPNAYTLGRCNACGEDLSEVEVGFTSNVFTGFVFGAAKGPFPLTISVRAQTEDTLVFDDILSLSPCHINSIPTDVYVLRHEGVT